MITNIIKRRGAHSRLILCLWLACVVLLAGALRAAPASAQGRSGASDPQPFSPQQLEQLVAPIALYPDDLLSQVLMASTYPLEVVQAARWASQNPNVTGKALEDAMAKQSWDPSVKGLVAVPQTLQMMSDKLDWTQQLGDAFLDDQAAVLDAVQRLRQRAEGAGNLKTSPQMKVSRVSMPNPSGQPVERIVVERADPQTVYVPVYDPGVAFGTWPYPDYPPYYWQPPGWIPGTYAYGALAFGAGLAVGAAIWGGANWWGGSVNINAARYNSFNRTNIAGGNWNHVAHHRGNVPYRNNATAQRFGGQTRAGRNQIGQGNRRGAEIAPVPATAREPEPCQRREIVRAQASVRAQATAKAQAIARERATARAQATARREPDNEGADKERQHRTVPVAERTPRTEALEIAQPIAHPGVARVPAVWLGVVEECREPAA